MIMLHLLDHWERPRRFQGEHAGRSVRSAPAPSSSHGGRENLGGSEAEIHAGATANFPQLPTRAASRRRVALN